MGNADHRVNPTDQEEYACCRNYLRWLRAENERQYKPSNGTHCQGRHEPDENGCRRKLSGSLWLTCDEVDKRPVKTKHGKRSQKKGPGLDRSQLTLARGVQKASGEDSCHSRKDRQGYVRSERAAEPPTWRPSRLRHRTNRPTHPLLSVISPSPRARGMSVHGRGTPADAHFGHGESICDCSSSPAGLRRDCPATPAAGHGKVSPRRGGSRLPRSDRGCRRCLASLGARYDPSRPKLEPLGEAPHAPVLHRSHAQPQGGPSTRHGEPLITQRKRLITNSIFAWASP